MHLYLQPSVRLSRRWTFAPFTAFHVQIVSITAFYIILSYTMDRPQPPKRSDIQKVVLRLATMLSNRARLLNTNDLASRRSPVYGSTSFFKAARFTSRSRFLFFWIS